MDDRRILQMTLPTSSHIGAEDFSNPTTLLEEYDPYIAGLIRKLQHEVHLDRNGSRHRTTRATS